MQEAENLVKAGVKELLVISQDTSAYGVDIKYRTGFWGGRPLKTRMTDLARALGRARRLGAIALRLSLPARGRGHPVDGGRQAAALSRRAVSARQPAHSQADEASGERGGQSRAHPPLARDLSRAHHPQHVHRRLSRARPKRSSRSCWIFSRRRSSTASDASLIRRSRARRPTPCPTRCPRKSRRSGAHASWLRKRRSAPLESAPRSDGR